MTRIWQMPFVPDSPIWEAWSCGNTHASPCAIRLVSNDSRHERRRGGDEAQSFGRSSVMDRGLSSGTFITTITQAEILYGVQVLPAGKRRAALQADIDAMLSVEFAGRILPFDEQAARAFSRIAAERRASGRP